MSRTPTIRVRYQLDVGHGVPTLQELVRFARTLEDLGEGRLLNSTMQGALGDGVYVTGTIREAEPAKQEATPPCSPELLAENEALRDRLDRIRKHYDDWNANRLAQADLRERVEKELIGHAPAAAGISQNQGALVALYLKQWHAGALSAVKALENIEGLLGLRPLPPEEDEDEDEDEDEG